MFDTIQISREDLRRIVYEAEIPFDDDIEEVVRYDYSGRGMYGRSCVGIIGTFGDAYRFLNGLRATASEPIAEGLDEYAVDELADETKTDDMGYSTIYYWPTLQAVDTEEEE